MDQTGHGGSVGKGANMTGGPYPKYDYPPQDDGFVADDIKPDAMLTPLPELRIVGDQLQQRFLVEQAKVAFMVYLPVPRFEWG
jgi:hypothetical protein